MRIEDFAPRLPVDYTPSLEEVLQEKQKIKWTRERASWHGSPSSDPETKGPMTETEIDLEIASQIEEGEKRVLRLRMLQQIQAEQKQARPWWERLLGLGR